MDSPGGPFKQPRAKLAGIMGIDHHMFFIFRNFNIHPDRLMLLRGATDYIVWPAGSSLTLHTSSREVVVANSEQQTGQISDLRWILLFNLLIGITWPVLIG